MSPLWIIVGLVVGAVGCAGLAIAGVLARRKLRLAKAEHERQSDRLYRAKMDGIMLDVLIAKSEATKRARAARWRQAQRRLLLK